MDNPEWTQQVTSVHRHLCVFFFLVEFLTRCEEDPLKPFGGLYRLRVVFVFVDCSH